MEPRLPNPSAIQRPATRLLVVACLLATPAAPRALGPNTPDQLKRFHLAADRKYCEAVPYAGHKRTCLRNRDAQGHACAPSQSCERDEAEKLVRDLEETHANLDKQPGNKELMAKQERLAAELKELTGTAQKQQAQARACWQARKVVHDFFERMRDHVAKEKPPRGSQYARDVQAILRHYDDERPTHATEIKNVQQRERSCRYVAGLRAG
jgi:hypothetical protein